MQVPFDPSFLLRSYLKFTGAQGGGSGAKIFSERNVPPKIPTRKKIGDKK